jgi:transcriptional regulator with XRE-family HTH domain
LAYVSRRCLLRERLKKANMTQKQLSQKLGMPISQISDYANDRRTMTLNTAKTISSAIPGCSIEQLYEWEEVRRSERK